MTSPNSTLDKVRTLITTTRFGGFSFWTKAHDENEITHRRIILFGLGQIGKLGAVGRALAAWTPEQLWPLGASSPGMWSDPPTTSSMFADSAGTTAISAIGTVLDTSNPVGLVLDRKGGATVKADPGIWMEQATATSRPVASARVNLLTKTEDFADAVWAKTNVSLSAGTQAESVIVTATGALGAIYQLPPVPAGPAAHSIDIRRVTGSGNVSLKLPGNTENVVSVTGAWTRFTAPGPAPGGISYFVIELATSGDAIEIRYPQAQTGSVATTYQPVVSASSYTASGFPVYAKFDGVDDSLSSATFAAGTLASSMDCLMAVRRDSVPVTSMVGLYETPGNPAKYFGEASPGIGVASFAGCGSPTHYVDGDQLSGGTAVTAGTLSAALTPGAWHILELRGLDMSAWTAVRFAGYSAGYTINGALGGIQLFASGQDANRDKARAQMAAYFGVTLP